VVDAHFWQVHVLESGLGSLLLSLLQLVLLLLRLLGLLLLGLSLLLLSLLSSGLTLGRLLLRAEILLSLGELLSDKGSVCRVAAVTVGMH